MIQVSPKLFNKILERVDRIKSKEDMLVFANNLINNRNPKLIIAVVLFCTGSLLTKLLTSPIYNLPLELVKDALPIYYEEFMNVQNNVKVSTKPFKDFIGEYEDMQVRTLNTSLWSWLTDITTYLEECESLHNSSKDYRPNAYITTLFEDIKDVNEIYGIPNEEFKAYLVSAGCNENIVIQLSALYDLVKKNKIVVDNIFIKQKPVLENLSVPIKERLEGARVQDFLLNYCKL